MGIEIRLLHEIVFDIDEFLTPPKTTANYTIRTRTYPLIYYPDLNIEACHIMNPLVHAYMVLMCTQLSKSCTSFDI